MAKTNDDLSHSGIFIAAKAAFFVAKYSKAKTKRDASSEPQTIHRKKQVGIRVLTKIQRSSVCGVSAGCKKQLKLKTSQEGL